MTRNANGAFCVVIRPKTLNSSTPTPVSSPALGAKPDPKPVATPVAIPERRKFDEDVEPWHVKRRRLELENQQRFNRLHALTQPARSVPHTQNQAQNQAAYAPVAAPALVTTTTTAPAPSPAPEPVTTTTGLGFVSTQRVMQDNDMWVDKYAPRRLEDVVGHADATASLERWLVSERHTPNGQRAVLITGSAGLGKTTLANLVLKKHGFTVSERNASDDRTVPSVIAAIRSTVMVTSLAGSACKTALIMDECDGMFLGEVAKIAEGSDAKRTSENDSVDALVRFLSETYARAKGAGPIIFIANETKPPQIRALSKIALHLKLWPLRRDDIATLFKRVWRDQVDQDSQNNTTEPPTFIVSEFVKLSDGDARRLLGQMQTFFSVFHRGSAGTGGSLFKGGITSSVMLRLRASLEEFRRVCSKDDFANFFEAARMVWLEPADSTRCRISTYGGLFGMDSSLAIAGTFENYALLTRGGGGSDNDTTATDSLCAVATAASDADAIVGVGDAYQSALCQDAAIVTAVGTARLHRLPRTAISDRQQFDFPTRLLERKSALDRLLDEALFRCVSKCFLPRDEARLYRHIWRKCGSTDEVSVNEQDPRVAMLPTRLRHHVVAFLEHEAGVVLGQAINNEVGLGGGTRHVSSSTSRGGWKPRGAWQPRGQGVR
jgi:hypothetical protein